MVYFGELAHNALKVMLEQGKGCQGIEKYGECMTDLMNVVYVIFMGNEMSKYYLWEQNEDIKWKYIKKGLVRPMELLSSCVS